MNMMAIRNMWFVASTTFLQTGVYSLQLRALDLDTREALEKVQQMKLVQEMKLKYERDLTTRDEAPGMQLNKDLTTCDQATRMQCKSIRSWFVFPRSIDVHVLFIDVLACISKSAM